MAASSRGKTSGVSLRLKRGRMTQLPPGSAGPFLQQILNQTGGQMPQPGQQVTLNVLECECCERMVAALPYTHTDHNPPHTTWSYCQECYDAGCSGPNGYCELDHSTIGGVCVVCKKVDDLDGMAFGEHPWCDSCFEKYEQYLKTHPIPPKNRFDPKNLWVPVHEPAHRLPPDQWPSIGFDPQYILNPASAPPPTRKKAHIVTQQPTETQEDMMRRLIAEQLGGAQSGPAGPTAETFDQMLAGIDPRDSETALKLFNWLRDNARLHKVATLDQGGYLFLYQEPEGSSRQGYVAGGTQGDQIVDDALDKARASGTKVLKGLCRKCFSPISQGDGPAEAESPRPGTNPAECPEGGQHEMAG